MSPKEKAFKQMSLYCRLRDALEWSREHSVDIMEIQPKLLLVKCCSCPTIGTWYYKMQGGHFIPRGSKGQSGIYFDERNVHAQCGTCNGHRQGNALPYLDFMVAKYGQPVVDELRLLDAQVKSYGSVELMGYEMMYKQMYSELLKEF
jgi:hypothetical protein